MKDNRKILTSILKTTQMGQVGIRSVLESSMEPKLRTALESQLHEYDSIENEAYAIASQRGWELPALDPAAKFLASRMTRLKLIKKSTGSRIADMMIQGNTQGMVKSLRDIHQFSGADVQINALSQKLLDCETANIRQMKGYL